MNSVRVSLGLDPSAFEKLLAKDTPSLVRLSPCPLQDALYGFYYHHIHFSMNIFQFSLSYLFFQSLNFISYAGFLLQSIFSVHSLYFSFLLRLLYLRISIKSCSVCSFFLFSRPSIYFFCYFLIFFDSHSRCQVASTLPSAV